MLVYSFARRVDRGSNMIDDGLCLKSSVAVLLAQLNAQHPQVIDSLAQVAFGLSDQF